MKMTLQEIFDKSVLGIIEQGGPAFRIAEKDRFECLYRSEDGRKCAAGHLIRDEDYMPHFETRSIRDVHEKNHVFDYIELSGNITRTETFINFVEMLQDAHDTSAMSYKFNRNDDELARRSNFSSHWKEMLEKIAEKYGLNTKVLKRISV